ncbi:hypothetical protein DOTSEDRAFT_143071 [Dothistroma septosporum NZE10]|uniref:HCP-like protein n=1 Tax=Dothistroma septosporum (strain NZE10 / CBS 128990) TaxID=675120 RepID=N1Q3M1_DOTSN|nr:hypothetical protein DOTSEDRAFT_143071 [Dothistroma septosporum NZE10]
MPGLKDLLKKKDKLSPQARAPPEQQQQQQTLRAPEFTFIRSTTESEEIIQPPTYPEDDQPMGATEKENRQTPLSGAAERRSQHLPARPKEERRLSERFHLHKHDRSRSGSAESSSHVPSDLPAAPEGEAVDNVARERREAQWEKRATILAMNNPLRDGQLQTEQQGQASGRSRSPSISDAKGDVNIQEAIRLHEDGDLKLSTEMFGQLANPKGANNALAQVLYGLALRHGWGIPIETERAIYYLSLAASNSASIEEQALSSGLNKGGAAKGELVLAIFELANCFRHGWGVKKDALAARQYYETAANLGDTDAMEEAAWCYMEGFGGGKDKYKAAQYLRLAESNGRKVVGNSWIWKDKYNPK